MFRIQNKSYDSLKKRIRFFIIKWFLLYTFCDFKFIVKFKHRTNSEQYIFQYQFYNLILNDFIHNSKSTHLEDGVVNRSRNFSNNALFK